MKTPSVGARAQLSISGAAILACLSVTPVAAAGEPAVLKAIGMHETPKYSQDFHHFDYANPDAPKGGTLTMEASGSYDSFNPFILKGVEAAGLSLVYETLMDHSADEAFSIYPRLAEAIVLPPDRSWVAFNLNPNARWHDNRPVTPEDVIWTFETLTTKGEPFYASYYAGVVSVTKTGPHQVTFRFAPGENRELPLILADLQILPRHAWEGRDFSSTTLEPPVGSGPYRVKSFDAGRSITYVRDEEYWGQDLPVNRGRYNFDEIHFIYFRDRDVATEAFRSGDFDLRAENAAKRWASAYDFPAVTDGMVIRERIQHQRPTGMQAFFYNTRRPLFQDVRVRRALAFAFDFEWINKTIMHGAYERTNSFFSNTELSSQTGLPEGEELDILNRFRGQIPESVFTTLYQAPTTDGSGNTRANQRQALKLLREAGWTFRDGHLRNADGQPFVFELLLLQPDLERLALPFQKNLEQLGIEMSIRTVERAQYIARVRSFDFDMIVSGYGQSLSPGNEQRNFFHSSQADQPGSGNLIGVRDPVVDALIELVISAPDRKSLVARTRALDRVLLAGHYVIPHFHITAWRLVYWKRLQRPEQMAPYQHGFPDYWWIDPEREAELDSWRKTGN